MKDQSEYKLTVMLNDETHGVTFCVQGPEGREMHVEIDLKSAKYIARQLQMFVIQHEKTVDVANKKN